jgi:zinc transporter ZupT
MPLALLTGLYLHSFIEGLPLAGIYAGSEDHALVSFLMGVTLHNIPIAIAFTGLLLHENLGKGRIVICLLLLAAMAPLGAACGFMLEKTYASSFAGLQTMFTAVVVGIFLHIATTIIFESSEKNHRYHISKLVSIVAGAALAYFLV